MTNEGNGKQINKTKKRIYQHGPRSVQILEEKGRIRCKEQMSNAAMMVTFPQKEIQD